MNFMTLNVYGAEWSGRAEVFASAATDTYLFVYYRNPRRLRIRRIGGYHLNGAYGAMARAVAAVNAIGERYAILLYPYGMANLDG